MNNQKNQTHSSLAPTKQTYHELEQAYDLFNDQLFGGQLPTCLITLQREKRSFGYFLAEQFTDVEGQITDEIAMNPSYFGVVPMVETMQTLVHEMTHLWQSHFGTPGRGRYHNEEWARKMETIGLMPSSTGKPGGKRTGDHMADYAIEGGKFLAACAKLLTQDFKISWYDRFPSLVQVQAGINSMGMQLAPSVGGGSVPAQQIPILASAIAAANESTSESGGQTNLPVPSNKSNRVKYTCGCGLNIWGKPSLNVLCGDCSQRFEPNDTAS